MGAIAELITDEKNIDTETVGLASAGDAADDKETKKRSAGYDAEKKSSRPVKKKKSAGRYAAEFFIKIAVTVLVIWLLCTYVIGIYVVHDNSSYPMLKDGDLCIVIRMGDLHTGDEVVYSAGGKTRFGRVVATPGDTVDIDDVGITVNGYGVFEDAVYPTTGEGAVISFPYVVPEDSYFILNDHRPDVNDGRTYGAVPAKRVRGRIVFLMRCRGF